MNFDLTEISEACSSLDVVLFLRYLLDVSLMHSRSKSDYVPNPGMVHSNVSRLIHLGSPLELHL